MKAAIFPLIMAAALAGHSHAQELELSKPTFAFDGNGGACDVDEFSVYAYFGFEGMVSIKYPGSDYLPDGDFPYRELPYKTDTGLYVFRVVNEYGNPIDFFVDPAGNFTISEEYIGNPSLMKEEGMVDVAHMKPCR